MAAVTASLELVILHWNPLAEWWIYNFAIHWTVVITHSMLVSACTLAVSGCETARSKIDFCHWHPEQRQNVHRVKVTTQAINLCVMT